MGYGNVKSHNGKMCYCVGPEKCNDQNCDIVKQHKRVKGSNPIQGDLK